MAAVFGRLRPHAPEPEAVDEPLRAWLASLSTTNFTENAGQLCTALEQQGLPERDPGERLRVLELIRPAAYVVINAFKGQYLNRPLQLPAQSAALVAQCDRLNTLMARAYALCVRQLIAEFDSACRDWERGRAERERLLREAAESPPEQRPAVPPAAPPPQRRDDEIALALHRAICEHSVVALRCYLLYRQPEAGYWRQLHALFSAAVKLRLLGRHIDDSQWGGCSLQHVYLRALLLAVAQPATLTAHDIDNLFREFPQWDGRAAVTGAGATNASFLFRLAADSPPVHHSAVADRRGCMGIDTAPLCAAVDELIMQPERARGFDQRPASVLDARVLALLSAAWRGDATPHLTMPAGGAPVTVSLGIYSTHFFAAGGKAFSEFVDEREVQAEIFDERKRVLGSRDKWSQASADGAIRGTATSNSAHLDIEFDSPLQRMAKATSAENYKTYECHMAAAADGRLCLQWRNDSNVVLCPGNLLGLREAGGSWSLALITAVQACDGAFSTITALRIGCAGEAYSARYVHAGLVRGQFQRVIAVRDDDDRELLLVRCHPSFVPGQTLRLWRRDRALRIRLTDTVLDSGVYSLLAFDVIKVEERPFPGAAQLPGSSPVRR